jgi:hypothetical protein
MNTTTEQTNSNSNLIVSLYGSEIAIGIEGTKQEINQQFNRFFNLGGAAANCTSAFCSEDSDTGDNYLHFMCDTFAYFLSSEEDMIKAFETESLVNLNSKSNPQFKGKKDGVLAEVKQAAKETYQNLRRENFMLYKTSDQIAFKKLDGGAPSLDVSSLNYFSTHTYL